MQINKGRKAYDDINITPMLDLSYVLLVIFIIMTTATVQGMKVNLPKASAAPSLAAQKTKAITVTNEGRVFLDTIPVSMQELEQRLILLKKRNIDKEDFEFFVENQKRDLRVFVDSQPAKSQERAEKLTLHVLEIAATKVVPVLIMMI